ncbi:MAG: mechanosensitive ion channel [Myxococcota bacterium]
MAACVALLTPWVAAAAPSASDDGMLGQFEAWAENPAVQLGARVLLAVLLFIGGWIVAKAISYAVYQVFSKTDLDNKAAEKLGVGMLLREKKGGGDEGSVERFIAQVAYYVVMLLVVVGVLEFAGLSQVAGPLERLVDTVVQSLPRIGKAALLLVAAYFAGRILSKVVSTALDKLGVDTKFAELAESGEAKPAFSATVGSVVFWLIMLLGIAGAFEALEIGPVATPLHNAIDHVVGVLPKVAFAVLLVAVGYFGGRIARTVVRKVLQGLGFDSLAEKAQLDRVTGKTSPSDVVATALMVFIIVQASIAALNEVGLTTLSEPLTDMMGQFWNLLPKLAVGVVIIVVAVFVGQLLRRVVAGALRNLGLDRFMENLGFKKLSEREDRLGEYSEALGFAVQVGVILLGVAQALATLQLATWSGYVNSFLGYIVKNVAVATLVVGVGFAIGNYVRDLIRARGDDEVGKWMGEFARYAVLVFAFTMAVRQLDVAEDFVLMTFGLLFGALCLGAALAFGLGGREVAGDIVKRRYDEARRQMAKRPAPKPAAKPATGPTTAPPRAPTIPTKTTVTPAKKPDGNDG